MVTWSNSPRSVSFKAKPSTYSIESRIRKVRQSSISTRVREANKSIDEKKIWGVSLTIAIIVLMVNALAYVVIEYGVFKGTAEYPSASAASAVETSNTLRMTDTVPIAELNDLQFQVYVGFIIWITMVLSGIGTELLMWLMFLQGGWDLKTEYEWRLAQFAFPLLGATTVGLANSANFLAVPFLVVTMWKFGFPGACKTCTSFFYDFGCLH